MNLSTTWQHAEYVLGAEANTSCFLVFRWYNDNSGGSQPPAAVDNVSVSIMPCSRPTDFEVTDATTTSITLDWTAISGESAWQISVNNDSSWVEVTSHPLTIDTLQEATFYTFYLRADCGTDSSLVVSTRGVTACTPVAQLPYVQTFDSLATGSTSKIDVGHGHTPIAEAHEAMLAEDEQLIAKLGIALRIALQRLEAFHLVALTHDDVLVETAFPQATTAVLEDTAEKVVGLIIREDLQPVVVSYAVRAITRGTHEDGSVAAL